MVLPGVFSCMLTNALATYIIARSNHTSLQGAPHVTARNTPTSLRGALPRHCKKHPHTSLREAPSRHCEERSDVAICTTTSSQETTIAIIPCPLTSFQEAPTSLRGALPRHCKEHSHVTARSKAPHVIARSEATWQSFTPISDPTIGPAPCLSGTVEQRHLALQCRA